MTQHSIKTLVAGQSTLGEWALSLLGIGSALRKRWKWWLLVTFLGMAAGLVYGYMHPQKFKATLIIAVEDDDSNGWQNLLQHPM